MVQKMESGDSYSTDSSSGNSQDNPELISLESVKCSIENQHKILSHLSVLNSKSLKELLFSQFFNYSLLKIIECIFDGLDDNTQMIRKWINLDRVVGAESVAGIAVSGGIKAPDEFIFKISRKLEREDRKIIIHEASVGKLGTNLARKYTPIFSYVFGLIECGAPLTLNKEVVTFCSNSAFEQLYIVYENVPGNPWMEKILTWTVKEFMSALLILLSGLRIANLLINFTHYDLHGNNVLCRPVIPGSVPVTFRDINTGLDNTWYVNTNIIPTVIDYGMSHFQTFGHVNEPYGIYNEMRPLYDVHRILADSYITLSNKKMNPSLFAVIGDILVFFGEFTPVLTNKVALESIDVYVSWLQYIYPQYLPLSSVQHLPPVGCDGTIACSNFQTILDRLRLTDSVIPQNLSDLKYQPEFITNNKDYVRVLIVKFTDTVTYNINECLDEFSLIKMPSTPNDKLYHLAIMSDILTTLRDNVKSFQYIQPELTVVIPNSLQIIKDIITKVNALIDTFNFLRVQFVNMIDTSKDPALLNYKSILKQNFYYL